jgi:hypothetical protein
MEWEQMPADPSENIVQFDDAPHRRRSPAQVSRTTTGPAGKREADGPPPDRNQPARQEPVEAATSGPATDKARNVAAIYKRATLASGLASKLLPDGTVTIERIRLPDFTELDRCLRELSDLGVDPAQQRRPGYRQVG